jgi:hypothetical protein
MPAGTGAKRWAGERHLVEIRPSAAAFMNVLDLSGTAQVFAMAQRAPWRALLFVIIGGIAVTISDAPDPAAAVVVILGGILGALELWHRRDFLTSERIVRQSGLLGRKQRTIDLADITRVEFSYPRFGTRFNAGDVEVQTTDSGVTFFGVSSPEELAEAILDARQALLSQRATRSEREASIPAAAR